MQETLNLRNLKTLLISARNSLNSQLTLNRTKSIKYSESQYFDLVSFMSIFNSCAEDGSNTMNLLDDVPSGDALLQQLKKLEYKNVEKQFHELYLKQFYKLFPKAKKKNPRRKIKGTKQLSLLMHMNKKHIAKRGAPVKQFVAENTRTVLISFSNISPCK